MEEPADGVTGMKSVKDEPDHLKNFEIDDEMETMLENLEDLMFEFVEPLEGVEDEEDSEDDCVMLEEVHKNAEPDEGKEEDENGEEEEEPEVGENEEEEEPEVGENEEEEEPEVGGNVEESENEEVEEEDDQVEADAVEEDEEGDEIVEDGNHVENESGELSEGETPLIIHTEGESKTKVVENIENEGSAENQITDNYRKKAIGQNENFHSSGGFNVKIDKSRRVEKSVSEDGDVKGARVVNQKSLKETENSSKDSTSSHSSTTCINVETSSTVDKVKSANQVSNKEQSLPNKKTDQNSHKSTNLPTDNIKIEKSSLENELLKVMDKCDKQAKVGCDKESYGSEVKARRPAAQGFFQTDFGVQTTFELSMSTKKELDGDLDNVSDKNFESGECTSSDDEEAVNDLREDKMFNHKIDSMMNNSNETGKRRDSTSKPSTENDKLCKKKDQIIKLLYKKIKSVGENKIVEEMLSKKLIDDESKEKLLEIIRYCVEKRKEKIRMKKLKKKAHLLKVTKNNTYLECLKQKTEVVPTLAKGSKTEKPSSIVVGSKITKRVIVNCNTVNLKSESVDKDLRRLIERKQNLVKHGDSSSLPRKKNCHKKSSRCKKKGCEAKNCKKHRTKEERKLKKSERQKRKIEILLKRREKLKKQYLESLRKKTETEIASTSNHERDVEKQKKMELEKRIQEKIALVFVKRDMKQATATEVSRDETFVRNETKQDAKRSSMRSREGSYSSDCSRKSTAHPSHSNKTVVKGPAADSFSEMYETLEKKSSAKEVRTNEAKNKVDSRMTDDDAGELFPTISSIICEDMDLDSDVPSPPPPPIISTVEEEDELQVEHLSRRDQHEKAVRKSDSSERVVPIVADQLQAARSSQPPQAAVKPRVPPERRSRSPVKNTDGNNRGKMKSRSRSRSPKHWKARSPATSKPEAIVAPRRRSPSPNDRYNRNRVRPPLKTARTRDPPSLLWKRRSRSRSRTRSRSREKRSAKYSPTRASPPLSPPRSSRLTEIRRRKKEDFEEAIRKWREAQEKPDHKAFHENGFPDTPLSVNEQLTFPTFHCMANQFVHNETFLQHPPQSHMPPANMMSPYQMSVPDTPMNQYGSPGMLGGHPPAIGYQGHDMMQAPPQAPPNSSGHQVATNSMADNGVIIGQSSGGIITTMNENDPLLPQGIGKSTHCHHHSSIPDAQAPFSNPPEGFPYFNSQTNSGFPPNLPRQPEMDSALNDGNRSSIMGFPMFPPPGHPPFKVVHHPQFPYPIPVPYIEPPCPAPPSIGPIIPFLRPPPNLNQLPPTNSSLNTQPPLPPTEPPPLINPPLPPSPAPSTVCSSPVRPSSPAISECGSVRSTSSRKKIRHDLKNVIDLIKGKLDQGEQSSQTESPCGTPRRNKSFSVNDLKDIITSVRKNLVQKKTPSETPDKSFEDESSSEKHDKPRPEERKLRIEFKKPAVKSVISRDIAPEFLKAMQEDEGEEEGEIVDSGSRKSENSFEEISDSKISDDLPAAESKDNEIELDKDSCRSESCKTKPKPDREALMQKQMKMLEILNGLSSKISKDHKISPLSGTKVDSDKDELQEKIGERKMSQQETCERKMSQNETCEREMSQKDADEREMSHKETGEQLKSHASKFTPSSFGRELLNKSKTVSRRISSESKSNPSFGNAEKFYKDDKQKKTQFQKRSPDYKSTSSPDAAEPEIDSVPDFFIGSGMDISPLKVQESAETQSATRNKNSADQRSREERKCHGQIVFCKSYKDSPTKSEHEKQATSLYKRRNRFSDTPIESVDSSKESHHRSENKSGSECGLSSKTLVDNVQEVPVPMPPRVTESRVESENDLSEKSEAQEELSTSDDRRPDKYDQNKIVEDQQVDCAKNESPANKISREQVLKHLKRELAHAKAACRASSADKLKNYKSDNQESAQEKLLAVMIDTQGSTQEKSSVAKGNHGSTQEKLSLGEDSKPASKCIEPVDVQKSNVIIPSDLKNERNLSKPENAHLTSSSRNPTTDVATKTDLPMNKEPEVTQKVMSEPSTSNNNSTVNPKAKISLSDPRLNRGNNMQVSKNNEAPPNLVSDPRFNRDPRAHNVEVNKNVEISQPTLLDPRLNRTYHSDTYRNTEISRTPTLDPRLNRTHNAEVGKSFEMSPTSMLVDPRLSRPHHDEAVRNVELSQTASSGPRLNREHNVEVDKNVEISQRIQQTETMMPNKSFSDALPKTTPKPNLKSLTLRVMNECDPVILREFGNAEDHDLDGEKSESDEIEGNSHSSPKEESTGNKSTTASKSQPSEKSGPSNLDICSEADTQNPKLKPPIESQNAGDPKLKLSPTERSEQYGISQKSEQGPPKLQSHPLREQSEKSQNNAQINKKINPQDKMNEVKEKNKKQLKHDSSKPVTQLNKKIISQDQVKDTDKKLVKDDSSRSTVQEHKKMHSQDSVTSKQVKENDKKPVKDRRSSLDTTSNKEKIHTSSTRKEPSPPVNKDAKLDSKTEKKNTQSSTSGNEQSSKPKSTSAVSKSESKNVHSNSKKTEGCSEKVVSISKDKPVSKIQNQATSKSPLTLKVDNSKLPKDKKSDKSEISNEHSKLTTKNRRSSYESVVPSTSSAQKNNCPSFDAASKQRRASLDLVTEKEKKKVELKGGEIGTSKQDISAKKSTSTSLEKPSHKSSNIESVDLKRTETVNNVGKVNEEEHDAGKKSKVAKCRDKTPAQQPPTQYSSSKFVVSNLSNKEFTNMEPPVVQERRSSVIEISSSDDESVKIISPVPKKINESIKKIKYKRSDSLLPSSNVDSAKSSRDHKAQKKISSSSSNDISKGIRSIEKKTISEVDLLKRLLESDSSDEETDFKQKKIKPMNKASHAEKDTGEKILENISTKKAVVSESNKEVTTKKDESENVLIRNINESDKSIKKVSDKKFDEINESITNKKAENSGKFHDKTEKDDGIDKSVVNVTNKKAVGNNNKSKEVDEINRSKININTIESTEKSHGNDPSKEIYRVEKSDENLTTKKILSSTAKEIITTKKVEIKKAATKSTDTVKKLRKSKEMESVKNVEEIRSYARTTEVKNLENLGSKSPLPEPDNKIEEKENLGQNLIDHESLESSIVESCQGDTKMKELTLSNEDFNFEIDSPKDVKIGPNTRKTKKRDKKGKLKNKFLKIGDDLFPDQESNESSDSFKNLITNICGTLEENPASDNPAVTEIGIKNCEDASLVVAECLKMLGTFVKVAQSVYRERARICVDNFEVTGDLQLIQHIADIKKTKCQKNKLINKGLRSNRIEKDGFDNSSIVSSDSYDVFEFSEDLPAITNDRRALLSSSTEKIRSIKPHLNILETEIDKTAKKDSTTQFSSSDTLDTSSSPALESALEINTVQSSSVESTSTNCITKMSTKDIDNIDSTSEKSVIKEDFKEEGEAVIGTKGFNKFSAQKVEIIESPAVVVMPTRHDDEISAKRINKTVKLQIISTSSASFQVNSKSTFQQANEQQNNTNLLIRSKVPKKKVNARYKANTFKVSTTDESTKKRKYNLVASPDNDAKKLHTSNDSTDKRELSNEMSSISCPALETTDNPDDSLFVNDVIEKSSIDNSSKTKNKKPKRATLLEDLSDEMVPKKKRKLISRPGKQVAETCNVVEEDTKDRSIRVTRARKSVGKVVDSKGVDGETSSVVDDDDDDSQVTEGVGTRVTRARKPVGTSVRSDEIETSNVLGDDSQETEELNTRVTRKRKSVGKSVCSDGVETSNLLADDSQETEELNTRVTQAGKSVGTLMRSGEVETSNVLEDGSQETEFNTRVTRKRKSEGTSVRLEELETLKVIEDDDEETESMNTRVTRARKSVGVSVRSDEIETSYVLVEDDSQGTEELNTRVTRARKSVGASVRFEEGEISNVLDGSSQETEELNTRVTRAKKSVGTSALIEENEENSTNDDPMEKLVRDDKNLCDGESRDIKNKRDKELEEGESKKKVRSSVKISNKEETTSKSSPSEDELLWIKICQGFNKSSRSVGTNVTQLRGRLIGFESFESIDKPSQELDLDATTASLIRLKQLRDSQKL